MTAIKSSSHFCSLLNRVFERHSRDGDGQLHNIRPWGGRAFRDGLTEYIIVKRGCAVKIIMLWYERDLGDGRYTSQAVRIREVTR